MCVENRQGTEQAELDGALLPYVNEEPISKLVMGGVVEGLGMIWDPQYKYEIKIKPSEWVEIVAFDILVPDEMNILRNCSLLLPSGVSVDFVSCRQTDNDDEIQYVSLPSKGNGYPEVLIEPGTRAIIGVTTSDPMWRGRAAGGETYGPINVLNEENAPVQFDVRCTVPGYGDSLCPVLNIYYKKSFAPKQRDDPAFDA